MEERRLRARMQAVIFRWRTRAVLSCWGQWIHTLRSNTKLRRAADKIVSRSFCSHINLDLCGARFAHQSPNLQVAGIDSVAAHGLLATAFQEEVVVASCHSSHASKSAMHDLWQNLF